jgi:hypothetical protein
MIARKQEVGLQLNQSIDALFSGGVLWLCHFVITTSLAAPNSPVEVPGLSDFLWMLAVIFPFAPFLRELQDFYSFLPGLASLFLHLAIPPASMLSCLAAPAALPFKGSIPNMHRMMFRSRPGSPAPAQRPEKVQLPD